MTAGFLARLALAAVATITTAISVNGSEGIAMGVSGASFGLLVGWFLMDGTTR